MFLKGIPQIISDKDLEILRDILALERMHDITSRLNDIRTGFPTQRGNYKFNRTRKSRTKTRKRRSRRSRRVVRSRRKRV